VKPETEQQEPKSSLQLELQARPEFMPVLRETLRSWLEDAGASKTEVFEIVLAATEAFANAIEHPQRPSSDLVEIEGTIAHSTVGISIRDYGRWQDEWSKEDGGLGLAIMDELMDSVVVEPFKDGTIVTMQRQLANH
jgi:anti-sigma regulatory factor (Ser/Thr protein kinase)